MDGVEFRAALRRSAIARSVLNVKSWLEQSKLHEGSPSSFVKRRFLVSVLRTHNMETMVETGTFLGDTTHYVASHGFNVITMEVDPRLALLAKRRFAGNAQVQVLAGDGSELMESVAANQNGPALFFLDSHYSGGITGSGELKTPVVKEVDAVLRFAPSHSVVIVDDVRCFGPCADFPTLSGFVRHLADYAVDDAVITLDSIMFTVKRGN